MTVDRYTRTVLTVIALALVYICFALTPLPIASAQSGQSANRPGDPTGPAEVVIVGWRPLGNERFPVSIAESIPLKIAGDVRVTNTVVTEQQERSWDRVVIAGWEEGSSEKSAGTVYPLRRELRTPSPPSGIPVTPVPSSTQSR